MSLVWMVKNNYMSLKNNKKVMRIFKTVDLFIANNGEISDIELANLLLLEGIKSSRSTVDRDLTDNLIKVFLEYNEQKIIEGTLNDSDVIGNGLTDQQNNIVAFIRNKRKNNKHLGQIKGGVSSYKKK